MAGSSGRSMSRRVQSVARYGPIYAKSLPCTPAALARAVPTARVGHVEGVQSSEEAGFFSLTGVQSSEEVVQSSLTVGMSSLTGRMSSLTGGMPSLTGGVPALTALQSLEEGGMGSLTASLSSLTASEPALTARNRR